MTVSERDNLRETPRKAGKTRVKKLSLKKRLLFLIIPLLLLALMAEGAVRVRERIKHGRWIVRSFAANKDLYIRHPYLGWVLKANARYKDKGSGADISVNSLGFRGPEASSGKQEGTFRIICLGGSTTFGTGTPKNGDEWPRRLENMLRTKALPNTNYVNIEVLNAAVPGFNSAQSLINLELRCLNLKPDLVIVMHAHNDIGKNRPEEEFKSDYAYDGNERPAAQIVSDWICSKSLLCSKVRNVLRRKQYTQFPNEHEAGGSLPDDVSDIGIATFRRNLESIIAVSRENGIKVMLSTMPTRFDEDTPVEELVKYNWTYFKNLSPKGYVKGHIRYNTCTRETALANSVLLCDNEKLVPKDRKHFKDDVHYLPIGASKVADNILTTIVESGILNQ